MMRKKIVKYLLICLFSAICITGCEPDSSNTDQKANTSKKSGVISDDNSKEGEKKDGDDEDVIIDHEMKDNKTGGIYEFVPED